MSYADDGGVLLHGHSGLAVAGQHCSYSRVAGEGYPSTPVRSAHRKAEGMLVSLKRTSHHEILSKRDETKRIKRRDQLEDFGRF